MSKMGLQTFTNYHLSDVITVLLLSVLDNYLLQMDGAAVCTAL